MEVQGLSRFGVDGARRAGHLLGYGAGSSDDCSAERTGRPMFPAHSSVSSNVFPISKCSVRSRRARSLSPQSTVRCTSIEDHWPNSLWLKSACRASAIARSEEHTSELQSLAYLVCRLLLEKKNLVLAHLVRWHAAHVHH